MGVFEVEDGLGISKRSAECELWVRNTAGKEEGSRHDLHSQLALEGRREDASSAGRINESPTAMGRTDS